MRRAVIARPTKSTPRSTRRPAPSDAEIALAKRLAKRETWNPKAYATLQEWIALYDVAAQAHRLSGPMIDPDRPAEACEELRDSLGREAAELVEMRRTDERAIAGALLVERGASVHAAAGATFGDTGRSARRAIEAALAKLRKRSAGHFGPKQRRRSVLPTSTRKREE